MRVLFIVLGLICAACAIPRHSRIAGGEQTTIENYPFVAALLESSGSGVFYQFCGGTLITTTAVVSASHCFPVVVIASSRVRLGSSYRSSGGTEHTVSKIILHELYDQDLLINDVAMVRLSEPAVMSNQISTARIAGTRYLLPTNTALDIVGWGDTQEGGQPSEILLHIQVNVIDQQTCTKRHAYLKTQPDMGNWPVVTPEMVCTGILDVGGKDSCQGDSGGPAIHNGDILVAITSWGYECGHPYYPGVNLRVSNYTDWIVTNSIN